MHTEMILMQFDQFNDELKKVLALGKGLDGST